MFTTFQQVEDWIRDNGFKHWVFYANNPSNKSDSDRYNDKILDSKFYGGDLNEKIAMTQKYLENVNRTVYGVGYQSETANTGGCICEFRNAAQPTNMLYAQQSQAIGAPMAPAIDEKALEERLRKQITAEFKAAKLDEERKAFEQERREFNRDKASAVGMMVQYLKPLIDSKVSGLRNVAGTPYQDAKEDVEAARIVAPEQKQPEQPEAEDPFTDEEADKLYALMAEFKQVEPDYMQLLEAVVKMAKDGDSAYAMAKQVLLSK